MAPRYRFGRCEVLPAQRRLLLDGETTPLGSRAFDLLLILIERRPDLVTKDELLRLVWPGVVVEEANVQVQVSAVRKVTGPQAVATIPGRGYRFCAAMEGELEQEDAPARAAKTSTSTPKGPRTNVDSRAEELIGRHQDIEAVLAALGTHPLVTLTGCGGIGKTCLADAVAKRLVGAYPDGVWRVDLAPLYAASQVVAAIASVLRLDSVEGDRVSSISRAVSDCRLLLLLDNCEHIIGCVRQFATSMLMEAPGVRLLVTSQDRLGVRGEYPYRLEGLEVPAPGASLATARGCSAVLLLECRAQSIDRRFFLTANTVDAAIDICRQLDGIPLAIEMAAARLPFLGVHRLASMLGDRLRLLHSASSDVHDRQLTLRATLEWSWSLLGDDQKAVLRRLAVFAGSFGLDAATAVGASGDLDAWAVLDGLDGLIGKSLVQTQGTEPPRYRLLETTRLYALEHLARSGEESEVQQRHGQAMGRLGVEADDAYLPVPDDTMEATFGPDYDDLERAFGLALRRRDAGVAGSTLLGLRILDRLRGITIAMRARLGPARELLEVADPVARARIWTVIAACGWIDIGELSSFEAARQAVQAWRRLGDPEQLHGALLLASTAHAQAGDLAAAAQALDEARGLQRPGWSAARRLCWFVHAGYAGMYQRDGDTYDQHMRAALELAHELRTRRMAAFIRTCLANAAHMRGDLEAAVRIGRGAVATLREFGDSSHLAWALTDLCGALVLRGETVEALSVAREALRPAFRNELANALMMHIALLAAQTGRHEASALLSGHAKAVRLAEPRFPADVEEKSLQMADAMTCAALGKAEQERLQSVGASLTIARMREIALSVLTDVPVTSADAMDAWEPPRL